MGEINVAGSGTININGLVFTLEDSGETTVTTSNVQILAGALPADQIVVLKSMPNTITDRKSPELLIGANVELVGEVDLNCFVNWEIWSVAGAKSIQRKTVGLLSSSGPGIVTSTTSALTTQVNPDKSIIFNNSRMLSPYHIQPIVTFNNDGTALEVRRLHETSALIQCACDVFIVEQN